LWVAVLPVRVGGPVLDARGRVVGVQLLPGGAGRGEVVKITPEWSVQPAPPEPAPRPAEPAGEAKPEAGPMTREQVEAARRRSLEMALEDDVKGLPATSR
jgi:hypothetical protein